MDNSINELESLINHANPMGIQVVMHYSQDKRRRQRYYAVKGSASISPILDYNALNHFLLGWSKCLKGK